MKPSPRSPSDVGRSLKSVSKRACGSGLPSLAAPPLLSVDAFYDPLRAATNTLGEMTWPFGHLDMTSTAPPSWIPCAVPLVRLLRWDEDEPKVRRRQLTEEDEAFRLWEAIRHQCRWAQSYRQPGPFQ